VQKTLEKKIPVIASETGSVKAGALVTQGIDYYKLGYKTGQMAVKVLKGEDISKMPDARSRREPVGFTFRIRISRVITKRWKRTTSKAHLTSA
jgi:ABC-type uncharacterized transport system substrate-binding protein